MKVWVLVIYFFAHGSNGVSVTTQPGFTEEGCKKAAEVLTTVISRPFAQRSKAFCIKQ